MTFREDKNRDSPKAGETSRMDTTSAHLPKPPPPGNLDPTLGPVDWDEIEMQSLRRVLRQLAKELGPQK